MSISFEQAKHLDYSDVTHPNVGKRLPTHPGAYLKYEFLEELGLSAYALARATHMPDSRISEIINGRRSITADTALRLGKYFGTSAQFWLNLQNHYDLEMARRDLADDIDTIEPFDMV